MSKFIIFLLTTVILFSCAPLRPPEMDRSVFESTDWEARNQPTESGLRAGFTDDNKQFNYYLGFLEKFKNKVANYPLNISNRIILTVKDQNGITIPDAEIRIYSNDSLISKGKTYADGTYYFYAPDSVQPNTNYKIKFNYNQADDSLLISAGGRRQTNLILDNSYQAPGDIPVDVLFILDTTGSMSEEIRRLLTTIKLIHLNLQTYGNNIDLRFGLVLYKDRDDAYTTRVIPLTADIDNFRNELSKIEAGGGGDSPEDLQSALKASMQEIHWNDYGVRLGFIITDAAVHLDYKQQYTYVHAIQDAKRKAVKLYSIGTGGLDISGEYVLRQISQYTQAKYIFLTYGEKGESDGGAPGSVSHHTGSNYETDKLEAIIIRFAKEEIAAFTHKRMDLDNEYFQARRIEEIPKEETITELFNQAFSQLIDYSTIKISKQSVLGILPLDTKDSTVLLDAEYFTDQLSTTIKTSEYFRMTERVDLQKVTREIGLQLAGVTDEKNTVKIGNFLGADYLISGKLYNKNDNYTITQ
ncbi:MAG: VWA domain-containing protein [Calditrichaceae bacterium]|nr:VWA domain-containing protein [Calditrichaceae bacterium]